MLSVLVVAMSFIGVGVKNYTESDDIARLIKPSRIYESYGYDTIDEWKAAFERDSLVQIGIGSGLVLLVAGIAVYNRRKN